MTRWIGVAIEGLGLDTAASGGMALIEHVGALPTSSDYEWIDALVGSPGALSTRVDPYRGTWSTSSISLKLDRSSRLAALLLYTPAETPYIIGAVSAASTSITVNFSLATVAYPADGSVIYVGDEAILLGTRSGAIYTGCTRGHWGTIAAAHDAGDALFASNPYLYRRRARVIHHTDGTDETIWQGLVEDVRQVGPHIVLEITSLLAAQARARLNLGAYNYRRSAQLAASVLTWSAPTLDRVRRATFATGRYMEAWQVGEEVIVFASQRSGQPEEVPVAVEAVGRGVSMGPSSRAEDLDVQLLADADAVYRLLCVDRDLDTATGASYSSTSDLPYPYHPVAIALALLVSTGSGVLGSYDVFGSRWGLGLAYVDQATFAAEIARRPGLAIDRLVLGWGGEEVNVAEIIRERLLRPYGYSLTVDAGGRISLLRLRLPDLSLRSSATANALTAYLDRLPEQHMQLTSRTRRVQLDVGGEPYGEGQRVTLELSDRSTRAGRLEDVPGLTIDLSTVKPERILGSGGLTEYAQTIIQGLALALDASPILKIRCPSSLDTGLTIGVGTWAVVSDLGVVGAWWIGGDGSAVELDGTTIASAGLVTSISQPMHSAYMDVELLMLGYRLPDYIHLIAPAGLVSAWDTGTSTITLDDDAFSASDAVTFAAGDELSLWSSAGVRLDTATPAILSIAAPDLVLDGGFGATAPSTGDIIRLARSDTYSNTAHVSGVIRPWAYLADATTQTFEDANGATVYDAWGTEFFAGTAEPVAQADVPPFVALDDDACDAPTTTTAWPLDAWLNQTWQDREAWLLTRDLPVTQLLDTHHGDDLASTSLIRPFCSAREATVQIVPVLLPQGWIGARAAAILRVSNEYAATEDETAVWLRLDLYGLDWQPIRRGDTVTAYETDSSTPVWQSAEVELVLDAPVSEPGAGYLVLWISSKASPLDAEQSDDSTSGKVGTDVDNQQGCSIIVPSGNTFLDDTSSTRPNIDDFAISGFAIERYGDNGAWVEDLSDALWRRNNSGDRELIIGPSPIGGGFINRWMRYTLTYAQIRAIEWSTWHADLGRTPQELLEADAPALGEVAGAHITRTHRAYVTPRICHVGPRGDVDDPYSGAPGYAQRWPRETHDDATATQIVEEILFIPSRINPEVILLAAVMPTLCVPNFQDNPPDDPLDAEWITRALWTVSVELSYPTSAGWTVFATASQEVELAHWYTHAKQQGILTSEIAQYSGQFPYREGSSYAKDLKYLQPIALPIGAVTYNPATTTGLIRARLEFDGAGDPIYTQRTNVAYQTRDRVQLALAGVSLYEVPAS